MTNQQCGEMRDGEVEDLNTSFTTIVAGKCVEVSYLFVGTGSNLHVPVHVSQHFYMHRPNFTCTR